MLRDLLGYRIVNPMYLEFHREMEKYYIYNDKIYQIVRVSKSYRLDGGWYVEMLIKKSNGNFKTIEMTLDDFRKKQLYVGKRNTNE